MKEEIFGLMWRKNIDESKHEVYYQIVDRCLKSIKTISDEFTAKLKDDANFQAIIKTEDVISPEAGTVFGTNLINFQVKLILEYIKFYEEFYYINDVSSLKDDKRVRRIILAITVAFLHELTHIIRGHNLTTVDASIPDNLAVRASETDADFLAGLQLYKWFIGPAVGNELMNNIGLTEEAIRPPIFFKDAGCAMTLLTLFFFEKIKSKSNDYHCPNLKNIILMSGFMYGVDDEYYMFINLFKAGYEEIIKWTKDHNVNGIYDEFLVISSSEYSQLEQVTTKALEQQRVLTDNNSEVWKVLFSHATRA
ncbi:hypothetical protein ACWO0W_004489 [Vibrio parahaemolyticus]